MTSRAPVRSLYTTGRISGGTGLGLTIVKNLVHDALHGTITVHSTAGQGASFSLSLPRVVAAD